MNAAAKASVAPQVTRVSVCQSTSRPANCWLWRATAWRSSGTPAKGGYLNPSHNHLPMEAARPAVAEGVAESSLICPAQRGHCKDGLAVLLSGATSNQDMTSMCVPSHESPCRVTDLACNTGESALVVGAQGVLPHKLLHGLWALLIREPLHRMKQWHARSCAGACTHAGH